MTRELSGKGASREERAILTLTRWSRQSLAREARRRAGVDNIVGLAFNLIGVLILFRWGMPFRVPTGGVISLALHQKDAKEAAIEHIYSICGHVGLFLLVLGTVFQIVATLMPPKTL
jgi:hypothetical protein